MSPFQQVRLDLVPVSMQVAAQLRGFHAVHTGFSLVALYPFKGFEQVLPLTDHLHESVFSCRGVRQPGRYEFSGTAVESAFSQFAQVHLHLHCIHTAPVPTCPFTLRPFRNRPPFRPSMVAIRLGLSVDSVFRPWSASLALPDNPIYYAIC